MNPDLDRAQALSIRLVSARTAHRRAEHTLACLLAELAGEGLFRPLGYVSVEEYAAGVLDLTARQTRDLLRIGRALPGLPKLAAVMGAGELDWTKARELVRVITPETEEAWIARARSVPSRVLEQQVVGLLRGDRPPDPEVARTSARADAVQTFVARMESVDLDTLRAALAALRATLSATREELDDGALLGVVARHALASLEGGAHGEVGARGQVEARGEGGTHGEVGAHGDLGAVADAQGAREADDDEAPAPSSRVFTGERYRVLVALCPGCQDRHLPNPASVDARISDIVEAEAGCDAVHAGNLGVERKPDGAVAVFRADGTVHVGARP